MLQLGLSVGSSIIEASWFSCLPPLHLWSPAPGCNELLKIQSSIQVLVYRLKQSSMKSGRWRWFWFIVKTLKTSNALCRESSIGWGFPPPSLKIVPGSGSGYEFSFFVYIFHCPTLLDPLDAVKCLNDGGDLLHVNHTIVVHVVQTEGKLQLI